MLKENYLIFTIGIVGASEVLKNQSFNNQFYNGTSELGCIWHTFGKLGYFWLFQVLQHWLQPDAACAGALKNSRK